MSKTGWTVWKVTCVLGLTTMLTGCAGMLEASPTNPQVSKLEQRLTDMQTYWVAAKPVADAAAPATYGLSEAGWLGVTTLLSAGIAIVRSISKAKLESALNKLHEESPNGAPALVNDPQAKAIIENVTGR